MHIMLSAQVVCRESFSAGKASLHLGQQHSARCSHQHNRQPPPACATWAPADSVWIETSAQAVLTTALEGGVTTFLFQQSQQALADDWQSLGKFTAVLVDCDGLLLGEHAGHLIKVASKEDLEIAEERCSEPGVVIMDASDWQVIPAENLVAACQGKPARLLGVARTSTDARVLLEALEVGMDGVVLRTDNSMEVRALLEYTKARAERLAQRIELQPAVVMRVEAVGMGDRVAVDLCSLLVPGEGLLVGSFSRALFLVHSECAVSRYIQSRPFRVNAGPVHAYVAIPGNKTAYLSELTAGSEVIVVDAQGCQRTAIVGRCKIETRPLVLIEAETAGHERHSIMLQNAETVRLVGHQQALAAQNDIGNEPCSWLPVPVTELRTGDNVLLHMQPGARHTGIAVQESIVEK